MVLCFALHKAIICCIETTQKKWISVLSRKLSISCATCSNAPAAANMANCGLNHLKKAQRAPHGLRRNKEPGKSSVKPGDRVGHRLYLRCCVKNRSLPYLNGKSQGNRREGKEFKQGESIFKNSTEKQRQKQAGSMALFQQLFPHILFFSRDSWGPGRRMVQLHHKKVEHGMARSSALPQLHQPFGFTSTSSAVTFPQCLHCSEVMPLPT